MKKRIVLFFALICFAFLLVACRDEKENTSEYVIYYENPDGMKLVSKGFEPKGKTQTEILEEMMQELKENASNEFVSVFPKDLAISKYDWKEQQLTLYFSSDYENLTSVQEVLLRAGVVKTLTQLKDVQYVAFVVNEVPLADSSGNPVGLMSADTFVENEPEKYQEAELTLYFANEAGDKLVEVKREVHYHGTTSMERLIVEQLIKGPEEEEKCKATISSETKIQNVVFEDGICYVNLNEGFLKVDNDVTAQVTVYSLVNSLTEMTGVNKVQIQINGKTTKTFRDIISLEGNLERNLDLIETKE